MKKTGNAVVFLGPSLSQREAKRLLKAEFLPPARQGDVWRAMRRQPRAIVLIDGVFEAQPSVWHHELRSAIDAGIAVFGASSMGALRAAELSHLGMVGVGTIFERFAAGTWNDDAHVALLQGPAELEFRALTVPFVNVWHNVERAVKATALTRAEAAQLCAAAQAIPYQRRTWKAVERIAPASWARFAAKGLEDLKQLDAIACLRHVEKFMKTKPAALPISSTDLSALARHRWMTAAYDMECSEDAPQAIDRFLLAAYAKSRGLVADESELLLHERELLQRGVDRSNARRWAEVLALEALVRARASHVSAGAFVASEAAALEHFLQS